MTFVSPAGCGEERNLAELKVKQQLTPRHFIPPLLKTSFMDTSLICRLVLVELVIYELNSLLCHLDPFFYILNHIILRRLFWQFYKILRSYVVNENNRPESHWGCLLSGVALIPGLVTNTFALSNNEGGKYDEQRLFRFWSRIEFT